MKSKIGVMLVAALLASLFLAGAAMAGNSWLCSLSNAVGCDEDGTIGTPDLGGLAYPTFLRVDIDGKLITLLAPEERKGETTKIDAIHQGEGVWVLSGVQEERAWSIVISEKGYMTLSVTMDGATWSVFGGALLEE